MNERFATLLSRKLAREATLDEIAELEQYLQKNSDQQHFAELLSNYWNWELSERSTIDDAHFNNIIKKGEFVVYENNSTNSRQKGRVLLFKKIAIAASMVGICLTIAYWYYGNKTASSITKNQRNEVVVKKGNKSSILLPDGSKITLNGDSKLLYSPNFNGNTREVELIGEAFFDVVKDASRPFIIHTQAMDIKVLGTAFNVKAYANDKTTEAALIRGSIEASFKDRPNEKIILKPNEKIVFVNTNSIEVKDNTIPQKANSNEPIITIAKITYEQNRKDSLLAETSWMKNTLVFHSKSFEDLALQLERWYNVSIKFDDASLKELKFTGIFEQESLPEIMSYLSATASFGYKINKDIVTIYKK
jgi:transmembrane sensor